MKVENQWLIEVCEQLSRHFGDEFDIPVYEDDTLPATTLGICRYARGLRPFEIGINPMLIKSNNVKDIMNTIKHEWAHYYMAKTGRYTYRTRIWHNKEFKELCAKIGCNGEPHTPEGYEDYAKAAYKYIVYCTDCGKILGGYQKQGKILKNIKLGLCSCGYCNGRYLKIIEN